MMVYCEICSIRSIEDDTIRPGPHSELGTAIDLKLPLTGAMFGSINEKRGIAPPFPSVNDWKDMRCPRCNHVPFMFLPDDLTRYNEQGGPDRVFTDTGWVDLRAQATGDDDKCPSCGRSVDEFKSLAGFVGHKRHCNA